MSDDDFAEVCRDDRWVAFWLGAGATLIWWTCVWMGLTQ